MQVQFDDERVAEYEGADVDDLRLAYCISVHKSQGQRISRRGDACRGRIRDAADAQSVLYCRHPRAPVVKSSGANPPSTR